MRIYLSGCGRGGQVVEDFTSAEKTTGGRWRSSLLLPPASKGAASYLLAELPGEFEARSWWSSATSGCIITICSRGHVGLQPTACAGPARE